MFSFQVHPAAGKISLYLLLFSPRISGKSIRIILYLEATFPIKIYALSSQCPSRGRLYSSPKGSRIRPIPASSRTTLQHIPSRSLYLRNFHGNFPFCKSCAFVLHGRIFGIFRRKASTWPSFGEEIWVMEHAADACWFLNFRALMRFYSPFLTLRFWCGDIDPQNSGISNFCLYRRCGWWLVKPVCGWYLSLTAFYPISWTPLTVDAHSH